MHKVVVDIKFYKFFLKICRSKEILQPFVCLFVYFFSFLFHYNFSILIILKNALLHLRHTLYTAKQI